MFAKLASNSIRGLFHNVSSVTRAKNLRLLWISKTVSSLGDRMHTLAASIFIFTYHNSIEQLALYLVIDALPAVIVGPIAGVYVDRLNKKRVLIVVEFLLAFVVGLLVFVPNIWTVYVVAFVQAIADRFSSPAGDAMIPVMVEEQQLSSANAVLTTSGRVTQLLGPVLGGLALSHFGVRTVFGINALTFLISGIILLKLTAQVTAQTSPVQERGPRVLADLKEGFTYTIRRPIIIGVLCYSALYGVTVGINNSFFIPLASGSFHLGAVGIGYLTTALGLGTLCSILLITTFQDKVRPAVWLSVGLTTLAFCFWFFPITANLAGELFIRWLIGVGIVFYYVSIVTMLQEITHPDFRGRVFSLQGAFEDGAMLITLAIIGSSITAAHIASAYRYAAIPVALAAVTAIIMLVKRKSQPSFSVSAPGE